MTATDREKEFIAIIQQNEGLIYKVTKVYAYTGADQQDLYQEIVYQLWKSFPSFRHDAKPSTWMYRVALNTSIAHLKKEKRRADQLPFDETLLNRPATGDGLQGERIELLYASIKELDRVEKGIILLWLEGKSYEEIASITGFSVTNVGTRLGRIRQKMSVQIKKM
jgi:RNA polymerase sigma factor (sigma-70 family)